MAITRDASSSGSNVGTSTTFSHTCGGTGRILFVAANNYTNGSNPTGATYNGVAMTLLTSYTANSPTMFLWYMINPPTGAHTVSINYAGSQACSGISVSYNGAKQTSNPEVAATNFKSVAVGSDTLATNLTTISNNSWTVCFIGTRNFAIGSFDGTGSFQVVSISDMEACDSNGAVTPAGSATLTSGVSSATSGNLASVMASFSPIPTVATGTGNFFAFM